MHNLLAFLRDNEPAISAAVGLITLLAALWGFMQFAVMPWLAGFRSIPVNGTGSTDARQAFRFWASLIDRGLDSRDDLIDQVSVRTLNACLLMIVAATLTWLVISLVSRNIPLLSILNFFAFLFAVCAYNLQAVGKRNMARWLLLIDLSLYWGLNIVLMGSMIGLEYFLGGLLILPLLLFDKSQKRQLFLAVLLFVLTLPAAIYLEGKFDFELPAYYAEITTGYYYVNALVLGAAVLGVLLAYNRSADESFRQLEDQKQKSDELIHRILPAYVAEKVSTQGLQTANWHSEASVMFASVYGFEELYQRVSAVQMVELLTQVFVEFDDLLEKQGIEKINTLGTNYVAATGIDPAHKPAHGALLGAAIEMLKIVDRLSLAVEHRFTLRVGISTGELVSGVIGDARPSFDVWGKTVDLANTLRGSALGGTIVVNEAAFWRLRKHYAFEPCGEEDARYLFKGVR